MENDQLIKNGRVIDTDPELHELLIWWANKKERGIHLLFEGGKFMVIENGKVIKTVVFCRRNDKCHCESDRKFKKCCGRPGLKMKDPPLSDPPVMSKQRMDYLDRKKKMFAETGFEPGVYWLFRNRRPKL